MKKKIFITVFILIIGLISFQVYQKVSAKAQTKPPGPGAGGPRTAQAVTVETEPVKKLTVKDIRPFSGSLLPRSEFTVSGRVSGRIKQLLVDKGDIVKNGQLIAVLDDQDYIEPIEQSKTDLLVAKANLEEATTSVEIARRDLERAKTLFAKKIVAESELDKAQAVYESSIAREKVAAAQITRIETNRKFAEQRLSYTKVYASWNGGNQYRVVSEKFVEEGSMIAANGNIISLINVDPLVAVIHVSEADYPKLQIGQAADIFTDAYPNDKFRGKVARKSPKLLESSRKGEIELEINNSGNQLKPGMYIRANIEFARRTDVTTVPVKALVKEQNKGFGVFLADPKEKTAKYVPVVLGLRDDNYAEVISPQLSGQVITLGQHLLKDGSAIELLDAEVKKASNDTVKVSKGN